MSGKRYPEEFKIEVVKQVIDRGHSVSRSLSVILCNCHSIKGDRSGGYRTR